MSSQPETADSVLNTRPAAFELTVEAAEPMLFLIIVQK